MPTKIKLGGILVEDKKPILVTAAAGQTGGHTVRQLLEQGHSVRAR